jgi:hypothetical protein
VRCCKYLGSLACDRCGRERLGADDAATWWIVVRRGVLVEVRCPRCKGRGP